MTISADDAERRAWAANAETYLSLVERGRNSVWRTLAGIVVITAVWLVLGIALYVLLAGYARASPIGPFVLANLGIVVMLIGLALVMKVLHRRPLLTLITPASFDWKRAWQGFAVFVILAAIGFVIEVLIYPERYTLTGTLEGTAIFAVAAIVLTPLQAATEELVFRGYLMQSLRSFTRSPLLIIVISSVLFMIPHLWNPEVVQGGALIISQYVLIAVFFAVVTLRDGRLELAIGAHAANNIFLSIIANYPDSALQTQALYTADRLDPVYSLFSVVVGSMLFYGWFFLRRGA